MISNGKIVMDERAIAELAQIIAKLARESADSACDDFVRSMNARLPRPNEYKPTKIERALYVGGYFDGAMEGLHQALAALIVLEPATDQAPHPADDGRVTP